MTDSFVNKMQEEAREKLMYAKKLTATDSALYVNPYTTADQLDTLTAQIISKTCEEIERYRAENMTEFETIEGRQNYVLSEGLKFFINNIKSHE